MYIIKVVCCHTPCYTGASVHKLQDASNKTAKQATESETTSQKQEGEERDGYRGMHKY